MKMSLDLFKYYSKTPVLKGCLDCKHVKPIFTLPDDVFIVSKTKNKLAGTKPFTVNIFNPYTRKYCYQDLNLDLSKPAQLVLEKTKSLSGRHEPLLLKFHPDNIASVFKKVKDPKTGMVKKVPHKIRILTSTDENWTTTYHFMSKDLKTEIGYLSIGDYNLLKKNKPNDYINQEFYDIELLKNYKAKGIIGERIKISYLQNFDDELYSGIGLLADKLSVEYCVKNKLPLNIVSYADKGSHIAHYKRGKRFFLIKKNSIEAEYFGKHYGETNINKVIKKLLNQFSSDSKADISDWGTSAMYLPQKTAEEYAKMISQKPILHDV